MFFSVLYVSFYVCIQDVPISIVYFYLVYPLRSEVLNNWHKQSQPYTGLKALTVAASRELTDRKLQGFLEPNTVTSKTFM